MSKLAVESLSNGEWCWNGQRLPKNVSVPCQVEDNGRFYLSLLTFAKIWSDHVAETNGVFAPPVTSSLMLASSFFYFQPLGVPLRRVALCPQRVIEKGGVGRALLSPLIHIDRAHFLTTLSMLFPASVKAEQQDGSAWFALDLAAMSILTQGVYVGWAWYEHKVSGDTRHYNSVGTVGLGPIAMAVKVAAAHHANDGVCWVLGSVPMPAFLSCWAELALSQVLLPEQNIRANLAGITAGLIRCLLLEPAVRTLVRRRKKRRITDEAWLEDYHPAAQNLGRLQRTLRYAARTLLQLGLTAAGARACHEVERRLVRRFKRKPLSQWSME